MLVVDIDGCIVDNHQRKHLIPKVMNSPCCWEAFNSACSTDLPVYPIIELVKLLSKCHDGSIHFVTSRGESSYVETKKQLALYFSDVNFELYMRPMDDNRHTVHYKRSVFAKMPLTVDSIIIDDHPEIIAMVEEEFGHVSALLVESHDCTV